MSLEDSKLVVGWREWLALPELGVPKIKAKVDTGARSSSLHALDVEPFQRDGAEWVRFRVFPHQRDSEDPIDTEAPVLEYRNVRSSSGQVSRRPVIETTLSLMDRSWSIELTLADRESMGFRMLLGREAIRGKALVDPGRSYYWRRLKKKKKSRSKQRPSP